MSRYAASTSVPSDRSRSEIERTVSRYGADSFAYGWQDGKGAIVQFRMRDRQVRFTLPMPDRNAKEFTHTPTRGTRRSAAAAAEAFDQAVRQRWRALALVVKAKLEAVESGIVTFEQEFGMHMVMPDGRTVADHVLPGVEQAYLTGTVKPLIAIEGAGQ
jgi:hypothetical protein